MILYISESLNVKSNGGSSLSGLDFLQIMRSYYDSVTVFSNTALHTPGDAFYGHTMSPIGGFYLARRVYNPQRGSVLRRVKSFLIILNNLRRTRTFALSSHYEDDKKNILFVNSWSPIFEQSIIDDHPDFIKVCIVRGNPESFVWQSHESNPEVAVEEAADFLRKFNCLIFVSRIGMERWMPMLPSSIRAFYLPNSIDELQVKKLLENDKETHASELGFDPTMINLVAVGSVQTRKGQGMLVEMAEQLQKGELPPFVIHVVGGISNSWGGEDIVKKIKASAVSSSFRFHGHSDQALKYVAAADICLFTSRAEAFPRTVAEYMALGKTIVATNVSGVPEMIEHGVNGMLCDSDDGTKMAEHVMHLLSDHSYAQQLGNIARVKYEQIFSKENQINTAQEIFKSIA